MGFCASVETNTGDYLRVLHADGSLAGQALLSFLSPMAVECATNDDSEILQWMHAVEVHGSSSLCHLLHSLIQAHYCGDWRYRDDEYSIYCTRYPDNTFTEATFKQMLQQIDSKWTSADDILNNTNELIQLLAKAHPNNT